MLFLVTYPPFHMEMGVWHTEATSVQAHTPWEHTLVLSVNASNQSFSIAKREQL